MTAHHHIDLVAALDRIAGPIVAEPARTCTEDEPPPCACGELATAEVHVGNVLRGGEFRRAYAWMCPECETDSWIKRPLHHG